MSETFTPANWRKLAGTRQGIINKLEKKLGRAEAELLRLTVSLNAANARLALYDGREARD